MAREIRQFEVSVPAGTTAAAPQLTALTMPARIARKVRIRVPRGPNGTLGFALASSGVPIIPWNSGAWLVADDEIFEFDLEGQIDSGAWQLRAYNTGVYAHTVYLTFELDPPQRSSAPAVFVPLPVGQIEPPTVYEPPAPEPEPEPEPPPPPIVLPPPAPDDGYAVARANALHALQAAFGDPITAPGSLPPALGSVARIAYDAGKQAALAALELV